MVSSILSLFKGTTPDSVQQSDQAPLASSTVSDVYKERVYKYDSLYRQVFDQEDGQREEFRAFFAQYLHAARRG